MSKVVKVNMHGFGNDGLGCKREGQARGSGKMDHRGDDTWVDGLALMDQDNGGESKRGCGQWTNKTTRL